MQSSIKCVNDAGFTLDNYRALTDFKYLGDMTQTWGQFQQIFLTL